MGNFLEATERRRAEKLHNFAKRYQDLTKTVECKACGGTGLTGVTKLNNGQGHSWNGEYCPVCSGTGYIDFRDDQLYAICDQCGGSGGSRTAACTKCDGKGILDWVEAMRAGVNAGICGGDRKEEMEESLLLTFPKEE